MFVDSLAVVAEAKRGRLEHIIYPAVTIINNA